MTFKELTELGALHLADLQNMEGISTSDFWEQFDESQKSTFRMEAGAALGPAWTRITQSEIKILSLTKQITELERKLDNELEHG